MHLLQQTLRQTEAEVNTVYVLETARAEKGRNLKAACEFQSDQSLDPVSNFLLYA